MFITSGITGRRAARYLPLFSVLLLVIACRNIASNNPAKMDPALRTTTAAFDASRHADTTDNHLPYLTQIRQLAGPKISGGRIVYSVTNERGQRSAEAQAQLQRVGSEDAWTAAIPAQPLGSTVNYYYLLSADGGQSFRHPASAVASYSFRVLPLRALSVEMPKVGGEQTVSLYVQATSKPSGEMVLRLLPSEDSNERRIPLAVADNQNPSIKDANYIMVGKLPDLQPGQLADLYFQTRTADGANLNIPADAPARAYSLKRALRDLQSLPGDDAFVLDVAALQQQRFTGLKGGGVWMGGPDGQQARWGVGTGLLSGVARFVVPDNVTRRIYVGTDQGVHSIEANGNSWVAIAAPYLQAAELPTLQRLGVERRAGPGAVSVLDGTLLFQLQGEQAMETAYPPSVFLQLRDEKISEWRPSTDIALVGASSMVFDAVEGCWLIGGFVSDSGQRLRPVVLRRCGDQTDQSTLQDFNLRDLRASPTRIIGLARDPSTGQLLVALEFTVTNNGRRSSDFGIYQVNGSGILSPVAENLAMMGIEVTSLATDWRRGRVLLGTFGKGLLQIRSGAVEQPPNASGLPPQITAIEVDAESGAVLIGTSKGAFELSDQEARRFSFGPRGENPLLADAIPTDQDQATGRVLLSSYASGLFHLERSPATGWRVAQSLRPGSELPAGIFGDAQYTQTGGVCAILYSQGLLRVESGRTTILGTADGLRGNNLLRILVRRSGDIWIAHPPMPFGTQGNSSIQIIQGNRVGRTIEVQSRELSTISRWLEVPERQSLFAATRAGVAEINKGGAISLLSTDSAASIARDPHTGAVGVVGAAVKRWDGKRFVPVLFRIDHPRWPKGQYQIGSPTDIAIDRNGIWYLLYNRGVLALLDSQGQFLNLLDAEDGIPPTARRLLSDRESGDVFVGSNAEGLVVVLSAGDHKTRD